MITGYVGDQIRRTSRHLLLVNSILIAIIVAAGIIMFPYITECLRGPFPTPVEEIATPQAAGRGPHRFLAVDIDPRKLDSNTYYITGGKNHTNNVYFFLHMSGGKVLIIKGHSDQLPSHLVGSVSELDRDIKDHVVPDLQATILREPDAHFLPVFFDTSSYRAGLWIMTLIGVPLLLLALRNIQKGVARLENPSKHPMLKQLAELGPPEEIAVAVDAEVREGGAVMGKVLTTRSWLLRPSSYTVDMVYLGDVAWAYKHETVHRSHGVATARSYATVIYDVRGKRWVFELDQGQVDGLLRELKARVPWAIMEFNPQLLAAWQKDRGALLAEIEERKRKILAGTDGDAAKDPPAAF